MDQRLFALSRNRRSHPCSVLMPLLRQSRAADDGNHLDDPRLGNRWYHLWDSLRQMGAGKTMAATLLLYSVFTGLSGFLRESLILWSTVSWLDWEWVVCLERHHIGCGIGSLPAACTRPGCPAGSGHGWEHDGLRHFPFVPPGSPDGLFGYEGWRSLFFLGLSRPFWWYRWSYCSKNPRPG